MRKVFFFSFFFFERFDFSHSENEVCQYEHIRFDSTNSTLQIYTGVFDSLLSDFILRKKTVSSYKYLFIVYINQIVSFSKKQKKKKEKKEKRKFVRTIHFFSRSQVFFYSCIFLS